MNGAGIQPSGAITNGIQLTAAMTSPTAILATGATGYPANLRTIATPGRGFFRGDTPSEFIPGGTYVYNNLISNNGGTTSGTTVIDGYTVPSGTKVCQYTNFSGQDINMTDGTNYVFRGCYARGPASAPGIFNCSVGTTGRFWILFGEFGGNGSASGDFCEVCIDIQLAGSLVCYRNRISFITTGIQMECNSGEITENFINNITDFGTTSHLNGITINGGQSDAVIRRNNIVNAQFDTSGREVIDTDCFSYFQDFGTFPGNTTNAVGTTGYFNDNNYLGGTGYCVYAGKNAGSASNSVNNMVVSNTKITTGAFPNGGFNGAISAEPVWGTLGNVASNNRYSDGPNSSQLAFGS